MEKQIEYLISLSNRELDMARLFDFTSVLHNETREQERKARKEQIQTFYFFLFLLVISSFFSSSRREERALGEEKLVLEFFSFRLFFPDLGNMLPLVVEKSTTDDGSETFTIDMTRTRALLFSSNWKDWQSLKMHKNKVLRELFKSHADDESRAQEKRKYWNVWNNCRSECGVKLNFIA